MRIILEGPDNTGKSTLAHKLAMHFQLPHYIGIGPVRSELDFMHRWMEYCTREHGVFDRHFCVSEPIYSRLFDRGGKHYIDEVLEDFYEEKPIIIFCDSTTDTLDGHTESSPTDTPEYVSKLKDVHPQICELYRTWADHRADLTYHIGDNITALVVNIIDLEKKRNVKAA